MLEVLSFTSVESVTFNFLGSDRGVTDWDAQLTPRGQDRTKMQAHGSWPRYTYFGPGVIRQAGVFKGTSGANANTIKDDMLVALLGDLSAAPSNRKLGVLTLQEAGWDEAAVADVTIESYDTVLSAQAPRHIFYHISWVVFQGFFTGDGGIHIP